MSVHCKFLIKVKVGFSSQQRALSVFHTLLFSPFPLPHSDELALNYEISPIPNAGLNLPYLTGITGIVCMPMTPVKLGSRLTQWTASTSGSRSTGE